MYHTGAGGPAIWGDGDGWGRTPMPVPLDPRTSAPLQPSAMQRSTLYTLGVRGPHTLCATHAYPDPDVTLCDWHMACISPLRGTGWVGGGLTGGGLLHQPAMPSLRSLSLIAACI